MEDYRKIAIELGQTLISKAPETREDVERMLPELKESEDERIRKSLIGHLKECRNNTRSEVMLGEYAKWIAWLEKQGEQRPADKVEPKFKVGDWVIFNNHHESIYQIEKIENYRYFLRHYLGGTMSVHFNNELIRLWTIQDAKNGDVLYAKGSYFKEYLFMFSSFTKDNVISTHFGYDVFHGTFDTKLSRFGREEDFLSVTPAMKEQRDLLFQKMKESGYEWDAEKKELKKIEQKPAWSEEDEKLIDYVCSILIGNWNENEQLDLDFPCMGKVVDQLKSLKDKVFPQPKKEWSDEDTEMIDCLIRHCKKEYEELCNDKYGHQEIVSDLKRSCRERWDWLESLKNKIVPQSHWKPTEEQIKALRWILNNIPYNIHKEEISGLLEQIQNL